MSTNYYLDEPHDGPHLGKWSAGRFHGYAPPGINSFDEWAAQFADDDRKIIDENGVTWTPAEMLTLAQDRYTNAAPYQRGDDHFVDQGVQFSRYEFC